MLLAGRGRHPLWLCTLAAISLSSQPVLHGVEIIAHRGASYDAPENTLPAVRLAWEQGADAVEIDIHQTSDGRIIAIHDKDTLRVSGRPGLVAASPLAKLIELDVGAWKGTRWTGTTVPVLEEILQTVPAGKSLVVEIKCPATVLPELQRVLRSRPAGTRVILIAFDFPTIVQAKQRMPAYQSYWLYGFSQREADRYGVEAPADLVQRATDAGLDGLDVRHNGPWVAQLAASLAAVGKTLYVYTVNDPAQARNLRDLRVRGITTDRPAYLRQALATP